MAHRLGPPGREGPLGDPERLIARQAAFQRFSRTVRTGTGQRRTTRSAVEPMRSFSSALRPCVPRTTSDAFVFTAVSTIASDGRPHRNSDVAETPRFSAEATAAARRFFVASSHSFCVDDVEIRERARDVECLHGLDEHVHEVDLRALRGRERRGERECPRGTDGEIRPDEDVLEERSSFLRHRDHLFCSSRRRFRAATAAPISADEGFRGKDAPRR